MQEIKLNNNDRTKRGCHIAKMLRPRETNLQGANLQEATGLNESEIQKARNWVLALYSEKLLDQLELPRKGTPNLSAANRHCRTGICQHSLAQRYGQIYGQI